MKFQYFLNAWMSFYWKVLTWVPIYGISSFLPTLPYKEEGPRASWKLNRDQRGICSVAFCKYRAKGSKPSSASRLFRERTVISPFSVVNRRREPAPSDGGRDGLGYGLRWSARRHQWQALARLGLGEAAKEGERFMQPEWYGIIKLQPATLFVVRGVTAWIMSPCVMLRL